MEIVQPCERMRAVRQCPSIPKEIKIEKNNQIKKKEKSRHDERARATVGQVPFRVLCQKLFFSVSALDKQPKRTERSHFSVCVIFSV